MKKMYIIPKATTIELDNYDLIATSPGGVEEEDYVGNKKPTNDNDDNFFVKSQSQWDKEW